MVVERVAARRAVVVGFIVDVFLFSFWDFRCEVGCCGCGLGVWMLLEEGGE